MTWVKKTQKFQNIITKNLEYKFQPVNKFRSHIWIILLHVWYRSVHLLPKNTHIEKLKLYETCYFKIPAIDIFLYFASYI